MGLIKQEKLVGTSETLPLVNLVSLLGVNDVGLCNHSPCPLVYVLRLCALDGKAAFLGVGGDPDSPVPADVRGGRRSHSSVCRGS